MRIALAVVVVTVVLTTWLVASRTKISSATTPVHGETRIDGYIVFNRFITLGPPLAPAHLTEAQAVEAAKVGWDPTPDLFRHPYTVQYGSFDASDLGRPDASGHIATVGLIDAWRIAITGLTLYSPSCGSIWEHHCPPIAHTLVIFVDDKAGRYLIATQY